MRLHRLVLRAFGPFPGTEVVDFDALADAGLFLLHGETGAGKTSVLDAVGFALYGAVPGARGTTRLRSDHAAADATPEVTLELTLRGRRLVVSRTPAHTRAKRRGGGTTEVAATARLEEVTPEGHVLVAARAQDVGHELGALLPLTAEQFFQVVLLPQGEFARFLRADASDRAALLRTLFRTERFGEVEDWFAARRAASREVVEAARRRVDLVVARVTQVVGADPAPDRTDESGRPEVPAPGGDEGGGPPAPDEPPAEGWAAWLDGLRAEAERARGQAARGAERADAVTAEREAEAAAAVDLARRQGRRRAVLAEAALVAAAEPAAAEARRRLAAAERVLPLLPRLAAAEAAEREAGLLGDAARAAVARATAAGLVDAGDGSAAAALRATAVALREQVGGLRALLPVSERVGADTARAAAARRRAAEEAERAASARRDLAGLPGRRSDLEAVVAAATRAEAALAGLRAAADAATTRAEAAAALGPARRAAAAAADAERAALDALQAARERHLDLRERRIDGMRAELASALEAGTPCPVCGSLDHPDLAELLPGHVDREAERAAEAEVSRSTAGLDAARARAATAARRVERLLGSLRALAAEAPGEPPDATGAAAPPPDPHDPDPADLARRAAELAARRDEAASRAAGRAAAAAALAALDAEADRLRATAGEADREAATALSVAAEAEAAATAGRAALDGARGDDPDVGSRADRLAALAALADAAAEALTAAGEARRRADEAAGEAASACAEAGLRDPAAARASALPPAEAEALARRVADHDRRAAETAARLADDDLAVALEPAADAEGAARRAAEAAAAARAARGGAVLAARRAAELDALAAELRAAEEALRPAQREADRTRALADLVGGLGGNERRMTLTSFVLAARLEEVAAAASLRLERMTSGRYTLAHDDSLASRGRRSGLGLRVRDGWTGVERDTATLSGGETFLASLSLALGLAEVVTSEAGGARLDTLFVDEGFGTLDPEALEEVLGVLDGLRDGGRTVGVVSHVAELRQRIPVGLRVSRGRAGSSLALVSGD